MSRPSKPIAVAQAHEVDFALHTLGWKSFQQLCATIATEVFGQQLQSFADAGDGGRDGAFLGEWQPKTGDIRTGNFTLQAKFTSKAESVLKLADVTDELTKAERLAAKGLCDHYLLFSNSRLTGSNDEEIREAFERVTGIKSCMIFGRERIAQIIQESARLRMLVPRIYGLGDLHSILDERAYSQAQDILSSLGDDLKKFVITDAYWKSAKALVDHGFVLLLGEPACGKSSIAAALALGANDEWNLPTIKIVSAADFVTYSSPSEKQFFWVDDAFGATQLDWQRTMAWNSVFPHVQASIRRGSKVIFTSRDYIYRTALSFLKQSALPVIQSSQVVIHVEALSRNEREQILYNHIKLGNQTSEYKTAIKPYLSGITDHRRFNPEAARRLGNREFTKHLIVTPNALSDFVERPMELLKEVIQTLDANSRAALALVFMRNGALQSPVAMTEGEAGAIKLMGGDPQEVRSALKVLDESFIIKSRDAGESYWNFKHPTIRDALAALVAEDTELMDIYLAGTPLFRLFSEVTCGDVGIQGVKVIVPSNRYESIINRIDPLLKARGEQTNALYMFLARRCSAQFLKALVERNPKFPDSLKIYSYLYAITDVDVAVRLQECGLLEESNRRRIVATIKELSVETPDSGFLRDDIRPIFQESEVEEILQHVREELIPCLESTIDDWTLNYRDDEDPESYFSSLKEVLDEYKKQFIDSPEITEKLDKALEQIDEEIERANERRPEEPDHSRDAHRESLRTSFGHETRSIFDDVDS